MKQTIFDLAGEWQFLCSTPIEQMPKGTYNVQIPGSVLSGLLENECIEDPYYRENEYATRDLLNHDFTFFRTFDLKKEEGQTYELMCDGIDTLADIFINDVLVASVQNMHVRHRIPCTEILQDGSNSIRIQIQSPVTYMKAHQPEPEKEIHYIACGTITGNQYIRKSHSMFGWDWGPQLPDLGIWRSIYIRSYEVASLEDVKIHQEHNNGQVLLQTEARIIMADGTSLSFSEAKTQVPELSLEYTLLNPDGEEVTFAEQYLVEQPQIWWPNRYGAQPLYTIKAILKYKGSILNERKYTIGLRTITVSREKDQWGEEFAFCVNGVKIFIKGANYIPEDCVYSWITPERISYLVDSSVDAGFNCLRVWGGGYYPDDTFYDLCDQKGLIVWQDFMYACNVYELWEDFKQNIIEETRDNVRRLRHHASLGLWCGNNEMESAWDHWEGFCDHSEALRKDYLTMFEELIPSILRQEDDTTFYWPSSPSSGGGIQNPDGDDAGDRHYWDVWHGEKPFTDYENYFFRFCSEFGFQSFPSMATIETFTLPEDRNIFSEVMESHQKNGTANAKILQYISANFLYPKDFESLIYISQVLQGIAIKSGVEHWRRNRGRCMGSIYWQINDNWPVASWASIDYFGRWKALHYMARHFYADILGSLKIEGTKVIPYVQNETFIDASTQVKLYVKDMECNVLQEWAGTIHTKALEVATMDSIEMKEYIEGEENERFLETVFTHSDGTVSRQVEFWKPYKHLHLPKADIQYEVSRNLTDDTQLNITLSCDVVALFVEITVHDIDIILSDNFIHLTDNKEHTITATLPDEYEGIPKITVRSVRDSYEV